MKITGGLDDKTDFVTRESRVWNVSVRGWLAILIIGSVCFAGGALVLAHISIAIWNGSVLSLNDDTLKQWNGTIERLALVALGYYFGKEEREHLARKKTVESTP
jgi:hypothetical protein